MFTEFMFMRSRGDNFNANSEGGPKKKTRLEIYIEIYTDFVLY